MQNWNLTKYAGGGGTLHGVARKIQLGHTLVDVSAPENLLAAFREFELGKRSRLDVQYFSHNLFENLIGLSEDLLHGRYKHGPYERFVVNDPKTRIIHKASVRDRVLHRAVYRLLYPFFDRTFIYDSYSCRKDKGTHKALNRFAELGRKVGRNHTRTVWVLKADIKKFFASIDQQTLLCMLSEYIPDQAIMELLNIIVLSFKVAPGKGLPLGNLTSQLFCNIYMNCFDQFVKHKLKARYYIRYADDFALLSHDRAELLRLLVPMSDFLRSSLSLEIHPDKVWIKTLASGADFLGWVHFPYHRVLRASTRRRVTRAITNASEQSLQSYMGLLTHGDTHKLRAELLTRHWIECDSVNQVERL